MFQMNHSGLHIKLKFHFASVCQGMTELPDYNKIVFPEMLPIPLETIVPDASPEVGVDEGLLGSI